MTRNTKISIILTVCLVIIIVFSWMIDFRKVYMVVFHKTGMVGHYNGNRKMDGEVIIYTKGQVFKTANLKNGILDGWEVAYYQNGNVKAKSLYKKGKQEGIEFNYFDTGEIKSKESFKDGKREGPKITYFKNGQVEQNLLRKKDKDQGPEHAYYENGKLKYIRNWNNDKLSGNQYFYYENGKIKIYHAYDILGEKYYLSRYDESGKLLRSEGHVISGNICSRSLINDSLIVLKNDKKYSGIRDLFMNFANPPHFYSAAIQVTINDKDFRNIAFVDSTTVKIVNAFPKKGKYVILLDGAFVDKSGKAIGNSDIIGKLVITRNQ